jgi:hypothetical protein
VITIFAAITKISGLLEFQSTRIFGASACPIRQQRLRSGPPNLKSFHFVPAAAGALRVHDSLEPVCR